MTGIFEGGVRFEEHTDWNGAKAIIMRRQDGSMFCAAIPSAVMAVEEIRHLIDLLNKGMVADELLTALKKILSPTGDYVTIGPGDVEMIRKAIAKAESR